MSDDDDFMQESDNEEKYAFLILLDELPTDLL